MKKVAKTVEQKIWVSAPIRANKVISLDDDETVTMLMKLRGNAKMNIELLELILVHNIAVIEKQSLKSELYRDKKFRAVAKDVRDWLEYRHPAISDTEENDRIALSYKSKCLTSFKNAIKDNFSTRRGVNHRLKSIQNRASKADKKLIQEIIDADALTVVSTRNRVLREMIARGKYSATTYNNLKILSFKHKSLDMLELSENEKDQLTASKESNTEDSKQVVNRDYDVNYIVNMIEHLVASDKWEDRLLALALASGRRAVELMFLGSFEIESKDTVMFSGQAKLSKGVERKPYEIDTLIPAKRFIDEVNTIRSMDSYIKIMKRINAAPEYDRPERFNTLAHNRLNQITKDVFQNKHRTFKNSRAIWMSIIEQRINADEKHPMHSYQKGRIRKEKLGHVDYLSQQSYEGFVVDITTHVNIQPWSDVEKPKPVLDAPKKKSKKRRGAGKETLSEQRRDISILTNATDRLSNKTLLKHHERVIAWCKDNGRRKLTKTAMIKPVGEGKIGGGRATINQYCVTMKSAIKEYNKSGR